MLPSIIWDHFRWSWETIYLEHTHTHAQMASKHMPSQAITNPIKSLSLLAQSWYYHHMW